MNKTEDVFGDITDDMALCLHTGKVVHERVQPKAWYVRTSAAPVKGMIRRVPAGPPYHRAVCSGCGAYAVGLYWPPTLMPTLTPRRKTT